MPLVQTSFNSRSRTIGESIATREDYTWRSLGTGGRVNDLNPSVRDRAQRLAVQMSMKNMLARRLIKLRVNYVLGNGVSVVSDRPEIAIAVQRWWVDQYNRWDQRLGPRLTDLYTKGEWLHIPVADPSGFVRIRDINTDAIADVIIDDYDHGIIDAVVIKDMREGSVVYKNEILKTIRKRLDRSSGTLDSNYTGDVWLHTINRSATQSRGSSELTSMLDYLEAFDKALWARVDMIRALSSVYFDLEMEGMSEEGMRKYVLEHKDLPPKPGTVWAHSPSMKMQPMTPDLRSNDMEKELRLFQSLIVGSDGWPGMLFDDPGSAGRAIGAEMVDSAMRNITSLQEEVNGILCEEVDFHLESLGFRSRARSNGVRLYKLIFSRPSVREVQRFAPAIERIGKALAQANAGRLLTREEQRSIFVQQLTQLGMTDLPMQIELPVELNEENDPKPPQLTGGQNNNANTRALPNQNPRQQPA